MIIGYDVACYSYGSGPCVTPTQGYIRSDRFEEEDRIDAMREILRQRLAAHPISPRVTSIIVTFHWGDGEQLRLRAGLLDRNVPERAPYTYQADGMAAFLANVWVGEDEPPTGIVGSI